MAITLTASGMDDIEFFLTVKAEGIFLCEQTITKLIPIFSGFALMFQLKYARLHLC